MYYLAYTTTTAHIEVELATSTIIYFLRRTNLVLSPALSLSLSLISTDF